MAPMVASAGEACLPGGLTTAGGRPAPSDPYSVIPKARFAAGSLRGCWAWRLAMLSLSCAAVRA
jgi:hypothetical protein